MRKISLTLLILCLTAFINSCCAKPEKGPDDANVVAKINNYTLTVSDFEEETKPVSANKAYPAEPYKAKEALLDELITRKVLLEEAQKQNFDKDKAFMEEIERYWEQALLKLLLKKKIAQLQSELGTEDSEAVRQALDEWVADLRGKTNIKIYKENLEKARIK